MLPTTLTDKQREELIGLIAGWSVKYGIGSIVSFLLEVNRPVAPITGNVCIGFGPMVSILFPIPVHSLGLLLQEDDSVKELQKRIEELGKKRVDV